MCSFSSHLICFFGADHSPSRDVAGLVSCDFVFYFDRDCFDKSKIKWCFKYPGVLRFAGTLFCFYFFLHYEI